MGSESQSGRDLMAAIRALGEQDLGIKGVHVHVRDRPPVEQHWAADLRRDIFSASKTFTSVAVGIAQAEGLLDGDDVDPRSRDARHDMTLSHSPDLCS
jgi:CubicO group peptidase (beta-lactamase class C family)